MRRNIHVALVSLGLLGTAACDSFLTNSSNDPNRPTAASIRQLFVGVQAARAAVICAPHASFTHVWVIGRTLGSVLRLVGSVWSFTTLCSTWWIV